MKIYTNLGDSFISLKYTIYLIGGKVMETAEDIKQLGGNIVLSGFREIDGGSMVILKKIVGNYARKFSDMCTNFESLQINMKTVHDNQFELHGMVINNGQNTTSTFVDRNLFFAVDKIMKKIETSLKR